MLTKHKLDSGLTLCVCEEPSRTALAINLRLFAGVRWQRPGQDGLAHVVEHTIFDVAPDDIVTAIEQSGGHVHGGIEREFASFWTGGPAGYSASPWRDLLTIVFTDLNIDEESFATECLVISDELRALNAERELIIDDKLYELKFRNHPLAGRAGGDPGKLPTLNTADVYSFYNQYYRPDQAVCIICGPVCTDRVLSDIEKMMLPTRGRDVTAIPIPTGDHPAVWTGSDDDPDSVDLAFMFTMPLSQLHYGEVLTQLLTDGTKSVLYRKLRAELGAGYDVRCETRKHLECGVFLIKVSTATDMAEQTASRIVSTLKQLKQEVTEHDMVRAIGRLTGEELLSWDDLFSRASTLGRQMLYEGEPETIEQITRQIQSVTTDQLTQYCNSIFTPENTAAVAIGDKPDQKTLTDLINGL